MSSMTGEGEIRKEPETKNPVKSCKNFGVNSNKKKRFNSATKEDKELFQKFRERAKSLGFE